MGNKNNQEFNKALSNFINDVAAGGAVRHLADKGYGISEIGKQLDFPISKEKIAHFMWEHFLYTGKISLEEPQSTYEKVSFVKEQDEFGKISFRRVTEIVDNSNRKYVLCEFGKELYKKSPEFLSWLEGLKEGDREYIELMPWPLEPVYHELDERMKRLGFKA
ncbi:MAG: hypothetical protein J6Y86_01570 [Pseudobutyrivibrio sp.]|nr:hypothetical protein [Pseudobutyrivibrio sp.]